MLESIGQVFIGKWGRSPSNTSLPARNKAGRIQDPYLLANLIIVLAIGFGLDGERDWTVKAKGAGPN